MNKKLLIGIIVVLVIMVGLAYFILSPQIKEGLKTEKVYRVGILSGLDLFVGVVDSFKVEMTNLGYIENKNIAYDLQRTNFEPDKEKQILKKFVDDKVDLIFCFNTEVALEAKDATKGTNIPVVFANAFTEGNNLVENLRQPGGNITGVRYPGTDVAIRRLEILHELVPQAKRIWLPYQAGYPAVPAELELLRPAAASLNVTLIEFPADDLAHLQAELVRRSNSGNMGFDAVLFIPESLSTTRQVFDAIASFTRSLKIPVGGSRIVTQDYGTLFAITTNNSEMGTGAAHLVDKALQGIQAGTIPIVSAEPHLKLNSKVAQELGIKLPEDLISISDEIIR